MAERSISFVKLVEERALLKKKLEEEKRKMNESLIPYLPKECVSNIIGQLPLESLQRARFVCKLWYRIIDSAIFIDDHLRQSETVLIFLTPARKSDAFFPYGTSILQENQNPFSVESKTFQLQSVPVLMQPYIDPLSLCRMKFMEIKNGKSKIEEYNATCLGNIRMSCSGLILLDNKMKKGGLIVMNPVTRELWALPLGTLCPPHNESYGLVFCQNTRQFKIVHLFLDELQYISCEILNSRSNSWKMVDGPGFGLFGWFGYDPIFAIGALHWVPNIDHNEYIVSMAVDDEKFQELPLPKCGRTHDRIVEMGGLLGFLTHNELNQINVWILKNLCGESWTMQFRIREGCNIDMVPLYYSRISNGMIFMDKDGSLYAYDCSLQIMRKIEMGKDKFPIRGRFVPHVNSLVSWQMQLKDQNVVD